MTLGRDITLMIVCYCFGCFTSGYYWVRWRTGQDIRDHGSGTVGARNVGRLLGPFSFFATLLMDFTKGALAVWLAMKINASPEGTVAAIVAAVVGHTWPAQLRFQGGKGVATSLGAILAFDPLLALLLVIVFLPCFALLRNFTLGGLLAFALAPLLAFFVGLGNVSVAALSLVAGVILIAHRKNIREEISGILAPRPLKENSMHKNKGSGS
ncbi:MAG: glycerol-3-phosphate acyltransferase [Verrucomicrobia subdivision 3 bacterium]|nr:glycerol-3-phosphate acyltransferase [Limisphaerales bacterium]